MTLEEKKSKVILKVPNELIKFARPYAEFWDELERGGEEARLAFLRSLCLIPEAELEAEDGNDKQHDE